MKRHASGSIPLTMALAACLLAAVQPASGEEIEKTKKVSGATFATDWLAKRDLFSNTQQRSNRHSPGTTRRRRVCARR